MLISRGYYNHHASAANVANDWGLFTENIDLLLDKEQTILGCANYFFCQLPFASCSFPYIQGDGELHCGYLLISWSTDTLVEKCSNPHCVGKVLLTSFAGSFLSGSNTWTGLCLRCRQKQRGRGSKNFNLWFNLILQLRQTFPAAIQQQEEYQGQEFTWSGNGFASTIKQRKIWKPVTDPVSFKVLVEELRNEITRIGSSSVNVSLLKRGFELKPFSRS